jgi:hypothetical protein
MFKGKSAAFLQDATTACKTCLKARTTISCTHRDCTWGNFAASFACHFKRKKLHSKQSWKVIIHWTEQECPDPVVSMLHQCKMTEHLAWEEAHNLDHLHQKSSSLNLNPGL